MRALAALLLGTLLTGCPSQALVQSAGTIPARTVQHHIGVEWFGVRYRDAAGVTDSVELPFALPYYGIRYGIADQIDIGLRTSVALTIAFDLKAQLLDTEAVDIAIAPNVQFAWLWGWTQLPLLVGLNLGDVAQILLSGRVGYLFPLDREFDGLADLDTALGRSGFYVGGGVGLYLRLGERAALVPEVQILRGTGSTEPTLLAISLGVTFGAQSGVQPEPSREPAPYVAPPPSYPYPPPGAQPGPYVPPTAPGPAPAPPDPGPPGGQTPVVPPGYEPLPAPPAPAS